MGLSKEVKEKIHEINDSFAMGQITYDEFLDKHADLLAKTIYESFGLGGEDNENTQGWNGKLQEEDRPFQGRMCSQEQRNSERAWQKEEIIRESQGIIPWLFLYFMI